MNAPLHRSLCLCLLLLGTRIEYSTWAAEGTPWGNAPTAELLQLLDTLRQHYGPDTVVLLGSLLHAANHSGSVLTTSVRVNGPQVREGKTFLEFEVETGLIFNTNVTDQPARLYAVWRDILAEAFANLKTIHVPTDGILIHLRYHHRPYTPGEDVSTLSDVPGEIEEAKFYFSGESLQQFLNKDLSAQDLLARTTVLINNVPVRAPAALK
jgi:hypothetical protein